MNSQMVRAGGAFVEMLINDETVQASLDQVQQRLKTFGAAVDATSAQSLSTMTALATTSAATTTTQIGVMSAALGVLTSVVYATGNAFRVAFTIASGSVTRAVGGISALAILISRFSPKNSILNRYLSKFLDNSQTTEAIGRWTRFAGALTGSNALREFGTRIERLGLGSAIVRGFSNGVSSGLTATFGAAFRSTRSIVLGGVANVLTAPFRALVSVYDTVAQASPMRTIVPAMTSAVAPAKSLSTALNSTAAAATRLGASRSILAGFGATLSSLGIKVIAFSASLTGPAFIAAKSFVTSAEEIMSNAKKTGESLAFLIQKKFGKGSLISEADVKAADKLGTSFSDLKTAASVAWAQLGISALPILQKMTEFSIRAAEAISGLLHANRDLITNVVTVAARIGGAVAAILAIWKAAVVLTPVLLSLASPLGLVAAGVVGIAIAFPRVREEAANTFAFLSENFGQLGGIFNQIVDGIMNALAGGSIQAAGKVLWSGLYVAWLTGTEQLRSVYDTMVNNIASAGINAFAGLKTAWVVTIQFLQDSWAIVTKKIGDIWMVAQDAIAGGIARFIAQWTGLDVNDILKDLNDTQAAEAAARENQFNQDMANRDTLAKKKLEDIENERKESQKSLEDQFAAQQDAAKQALKDAQAEFNAAKKNAEALRQKRFGPEAASRLAGSEFSSTLGTFSAGEATRSGVAGVSPLLKAAEKTAEATQETAENTRKMGGLSFA